jgi:hypothetical protein
MIAGLIAQLLLADSDLTGDLGTWKPDGSTSVASVFTNNELPTHDGEDDGTTDDILPALIVWIRSAPKAAGTRGTRAWDVFFEINGYFADNDNLEAGRVIMAKVTALLDEHDKADTDDGLYTAVAWWVDAPEDIGPDANGIPRIAVRGRAAVEEI